MQVEQSTGQGGCMPLEYLAASSACTQLPVQVSCIGRQHRGARRPGLPMLQALARC